MNNLWLKGMVIIINMVLAQEKYNLNMKLKEKEKIYKQKIKNTKKQKSKQVKTRNKVQKAVKNKTIRAKVVVYVLLIFSALLVVSYRNSQITEKFTEVKNMKNDLAKVQKENEQLEASIESSINLKTIQQEAESQLGMKKIGWRSKSLYKSS